MNDIRQGKCDFADYEGDKHRVIWTVGLDSNGRFDRKQLIKNTDIWMLKVIVDDELCVWFADGKWNKRPPFFGIARDAYKMLLVLYS